MLSEGRKLGSALRIRRAVKSRGVAEISSPRPGTSQKAEEGVLVQVRRD